MNFEELKTRIFALLANKNHPMLGKAQFAKLSYEEVKRFRELAGRAEAIQRGLERALGKLTSDRNRLWADLADKYNFHGQPVHYDDESGALYRE